ncbi:MAG TPA: hypothetical protein VLD36_07850 [Burkholderiales bacterium]|nr:hypothetical protein [Burkholderiales bacterium]
MTAAYPGTDESLPPRGERIEVHVGELRQMYNAMDPAPFRERDLDPKAEEFIVDSARELHRDAPLALVVRVSRQAATPEDVAALQDAVREYFAHSAAASRSQLRRLFRTGRWTLLIGLVFVAAANLIGDLVADLIGRYNYGRFLHESIVIGAWVALWRPMEIFLYDWWPILGEARLFDRLSAMRVQVVRADAQNN